jgi:hypothetical protein
VVSWVREFWDQVELALTRIDLTIGVLVQFAIEEAADKGLSEAEQKAAGATITKFWDPDPCPDLRTRWSSEIEQRERRAPNVPRREMKHGRSRIRAEDVAADDEYAAMLRCTGLDEHQLRRIRLEQTPP